MLDLLILGTGPAGCAAAIQARRSGQSVLMIARPGVARPAPGETLHPGIEPIFERLGVLEAVLTENFHRHRGIWTQWNGPRVFETFGKDDRGPWYGFQADRRRLSNLLLEAARGLGAELNSTVSPEFPIVESGRVRGVVAGGAEFAARWTMDGTGRSAWLAGKLNIKCFRPSPPMVARFWWSDSADSELDGQPCISAEPKGWSWSAPLCGSRTAHVSLTLDNVDNASRKHAGTDVSWRIHRRCAGPGYILLGEAAAALDPLSSHGVLRALMAGMLGAHLTGACGHGRLPEVDLIEQYSQWMTQQFDFDVAALTDLYHRHPSKHVSDLFAAG